MCNIHTYIHSPNAQFRGTNYLRFNISAAEPRRKASLPGCFMSGERQRSLEAPKGMYFFPLPFILHRMMLILSISSLLTWDVGL